MQTSAMDESALTEHSVSIIPQVISKYESLYIFRFRHQVNRLPVKRSIRSIRKKIKKIPIKNKSFVICFIYIVIVFFVRFWQPVWH